MLYILNTLYMWSRQIFTLGHSHALLLPIAVVREMGWKPRDLIVVEVLGPNKVQLSKLFPARDVELAQAVTDLVHEPTTTRENREAWN